MTISLQINFRENIEELLETAWSYYYLSLCETSPQRSLVPFLHIVRAIDLNTSCPNINVGLVEHVVVAACSGLFPLILAYPNTNDIELNISGDIEDYLQRIVCPNSNHNMTTDSSAIELDSNTKEIQVIIERTYQLFQLFQYEKCRLTVIGLFSNYLLGSSSVEPLEVDSVSLLTKLFHRSEIVFKSVLYIILALFIGCQKSNIVVDVEFWTRLVLEGSNFPYSIVRHSCILSLRVLVPLQPLSAQKPNVSGTLGASWKYPDTIEDGWNKIVLSLSCCSQLASCLSADGEFMDSLVESKTVSTVEGKYYRLRKYQWGGVQWITRLWNLGFGGGILADEMGLG